MDEWYCEYCNCIVDPKHVTFSERHDPREGGCGHIVGTIAEANKKDALRAQLDEARRGGERYRWCKKNCVYEFDRWMLHGVIILACQGN